MTQTASAFSSSDTAVLERAVETTDAPVVLEQIWNENHRKIAISWIRQNGYKKICLQFPDAYLPFSNAISDSFKELLQISGGPLLSDAKIFILADTTYGSCCIDEIAAAHVEGDSIIHFGFACRSKVTRVPVLYMFPQLPIDLPQFFDKVKNVGDIFEQQSACIYLDIGYHYLLEQDPEDSGEDYLSKTIREILHCKELHIEVFPPPAEDAKIDATVTNTNEEKICIFVGSDNNSFFNLSLTAKASRWFIFDPIANTIKEKNPLTANFIRRRYYYIEKCKDAKTLGLIVATLTTEGYLDVITRLQEMAKSHGIKTQIISVGRINPAKLANFLEIDCFVLIGCPFNNMYTAKDYYKPIVSVFEAEMALNPAWHMKYPESYVTDFKQLLPEGSSFLKFIPENVTPQDVSLVSGHMRNTESVDDAQVSTALSSQEQSVATPGRIEMMTNNVGLNFEDRTWKGLDPALGQTEPAKLQKGLSGIPIRYSHD